MSMEAALKRINKKRLFLFDIDGTLAVEERLYEGTRELLAYILEIGGQSYFITNNSTKSDADYVAKFARWGIETTEEQFVTAGYLTELYLRENVGERKIYAVGTRSFVQGLAAGGFRVTEQADEDVECVLVGFDSELNYNKITDVCKLLQGKDVQYLATNPDLCCPVEFGFVPDCGAICEMIAYAVGRRPQFLGKPSARVVEVCLERSGFTKEECLVVGDRLYTDIACGINGGVDTCVVFTGEAQRADLENTLWKPDFWMENIALLLQVVQESYKIK